MLGVLRFHLGMYNLANRGDSTKFKEWVMRTIGEEPVLLDTVLTARSRKQIKQFMNNIGYFNAEVTDTILVAKSGKKADVIYTIKSNAPYIFQNFTYITSDTAIDSLIKSAAPNTLIVSGSNYDASLLQKERERLTTLLKDNGYYYFNQQYIKVEIDSSLKSNKVNIFMTVSNPNPQINDSLNTVRHEKYTLNKILIRTDFDPLSLTEKPVTDTINYNDYLFISSSPKLKFRPATLIDHIYFKPGDFYRLSDHENTYRALGDLANFRFINIKIEVDSEAISKRENKLNAYLNLTPLLKQSYRIELEGTHNGGNFGAAGNFIYTNKNTFKGSEITEIKLKGAVENLTNTSIVNENKFLLFNIFNTYELGPEATLAIPRVIPLLRSKNKSITSFTNFQASYNLQQRPEFFRRIADFSAGFTKKYSDRSRLQVNVAEINFVSVNPDPVFKQKLEAIGDPALTDSYEDHLITSGRLSYVFTTQELNKLKNFIFVRLNFEAAGNSIRLVDELSKRVTNRDSSYSILGNTYAQYLKPEVDFRFYHLLDEHNTLVYRIAGGIGIPYLNSAALPFEKSFYAGGANDLRAFTARTIGPGSFRQEQIIQQTGEIKINGNLEYRFDIFRILQGAMFVDAGNVWLTKEDENRPGGKFDFNKFYNEFGIGGGLGFRFNFTFFIFRIDAGYKFHDPTMPTDQRWVFDKLSLGNGVYNFGIGYPF